MSFERSFGTRELCWLCVTTAITASAIILAAEEADRDVSAIRQFMAIKYDGATYGMDGYLPAEPGEVEFTGISFLRDTEVAPIAEDALSAVLNRTRFYRTAVHLPSGEFRGAVVAVTRIADRQDIRACLDPQLVNPSVKFLRLFENAHVGDLEEQTRFVLALGELFASVRGVGEVRNHHTVIVKARESTHLVEIWSKEYESATASHRRSVGVAFDKDGAILEVWFEDPDGARLPESWY